MMVCTSSTLASLAVAACAVIFVPIASAQPMLMRFNPSSFGNTNENDESRTISNEERERDGLRALFEALSTERRFLTGSDISFSMGEEPMQSFSFPTQSFSYPVQSFSFSFGPGDDLSSSFSGNGSVSDASGAATSDPQSTLTNGLTSNDAGRGSETGGNAFADDGDDGGSASTNALLFGILGAVAILSLFGMLINEITKCSRVSLNDADTTLANAPASPVSMV